MQIPTGMAKRDKVLAVSVGLATIGVCVFSASASVGALFIFKEVIIMYDNISKKLKDLAKAVFLIGVIVSVIAGISMIDSDDDLIFGGFLVMLLGSVVSWASSWFIYGFGELIEKVTNIERYKCGGSAKSGSVSERVNELARLRSQGLITEEEYQNAMLKNEKGE